MNVESLKGQYRGSRVFIVGNGASLLNTPLGSLDKEFTIATGRIAKIFEHTYWRPSFFVAVPYSEMDEWYFEAIKQARITSFVWDQLEFALRDRMYEIWRNSSICYVNFTDTNGLYRESKADTSLWSNDASEFVSCYGTLTFAAAQLAVYLGFDPIYFVGCDRDNRPFVPDYYTDVEQRFIQDHDPTPAIIAAHRIVKDVVLDLGVDVYDATVEKSMNIYPQVEISGLLSDK